jgi:GMP synthase-like glutamine amidotransferase
METKKPVAVFRHSPGDEPGYLASFLDSQNISWQLISVDRGDAIPQSCQDFSGLAFMGGPMSVNDDLPWIEPILTLIRAAIADDVPVLGHCLGGQLLSRALGGAVQTNPVQEIGWHRITIADNALARHWFGHVGSDFLSFHWHRETFDIPAAATVLMSSQYCRNQAFALGPHLGMQCHIEMTPDMVQDWCVSGAQDLLCESPVPNIQQQPAILDQLPERIAALHAVATGVYTQWIKNLRY